MSKTLKGQRTKFNKRPGMPSRFNDCNHRGQQAFWWENVTYVYHSSQAAVRCLLSSYQYLGWGVKYASLHASGGVGWGKERCVNTLTGPQKEPLTVYNPDGVHPIKQDAWSPTTSSSSSSLFAIRKNIRVYKCKGQTGCQKRLIHRAGRPW